MLFNKDGWGKVDVPDSVSYLHWTPIFKWYSDRCASRIDTKETHGQKRLDYMLKNDSQSGFNNWETYITL